jgi:uncharacterized membrane protein YqaE (UPF0057 family)
MVNYRIIYHYNFLESDSYMMYLLAIFLPPVAVLMAGKPFQAIISVILWLFFWIPGSIHALFVVHAHKADKRAEKQAQMIIDGQNKHSQ